MAARKKNKRVVVIGGGTGTFVVLSALRGSPIELSSIVSMADNGGSTGRLRDQYGVLPPGDIRCSLVALSGADLILRELFNYRFSSGDLKEHNFGNIFLSALEKITGSFDEAVKEASRILNIKGSVVPVTLDNVNLQARLASGLVIKGETNIDIPKHDPTVAIEEVWLEPQAGINPQAKKDILSADMIVIGPGDLFTSIIPNFLVGGVASAVKRSRAKKVFVCNLMTKLGETHGFKAQDFITTLERYLGKGVLDYVIFNRKKPSVKVLSEYQKENSHFVDIGGLDMKSKKPKYILADLIDSGKLIRHSLNGQLAEALLSLL
ncbi:MAG: uridine diphosphate-N-acetylglucosamine-binding protein YvcK [Candidatus Paceibacterota bacterium]